MAKNKYYREFTYSEIRIGFNSMLKEISNKPKWIKFLLFKAWKDFQKGKFSYDGATFVPERFNNTLFEVASFIHDWLNGIGYVGKNVDKLFVIIMNQLQYKKSHIKLRKCLMIFTPLNVLRHKYLKTFKGDIEINNYIKSF